MTRNEARAQGLRAYSTGAPCVRGHAGPRLVSTGACRACLAAAHVARRRRDPAAFIKKQAAYRAANREKIREADRRAKGFPAPTRPCPKACENCGRVQEGRALALDHCHETGAFRGWLCVKCNVGIGKLGDTLAAVLRAADYLRRAVS